MSTKIYTKTGDDGTTGLFGSDRVPKDSERIEAYGTVDELNSAIGVARAHAKAPETARLLEDLQKDLFVLGADLATPLSTRSNYQIPRIIKPDCERLEQLIDRYEAQLQPLTQFILPGGSILAAHLHLARTVCRRAERRLVSLRRTQEIGQFDLIFLNRLSDLLFVLARYANHSEGIADVTWAGSR